MDNLRQLANFTGMRDFNQDDPLHIQELINKFTEGSGVISTIAYPASGTVFAEASILRDGKRVRTSTLTPSYAESVISVILKLI